MELARAAAYRINNVIEYALHTRGEHEVNMHVHALDADSAHIHYSHCHRIEFRHHYRESVPNDSYRRRITSASSDLRPSQRAFICVKKSNVENHEPYANGNDLMR